MNGRDGIELAAKVIPDLILLDIQLPELDGYQVARALRSNAALDKVPIVAVTSYAMVGDPRECVRRRRNDYIEKPINPDTFIKQISNHLLDVEETFRNERADR